MPRHANGAQSARRWVQNVSIEVRVDYYKLLREALQCREVTPFLLDSFYIVSSLDGEMWGYADSFVTDSDSFTTDSDADSFGDDDFEEHPFVDAKAWADMEVDAICEAAEARMRRLEGDLAEVDIYTRERPSRPWWEMS
jgi:hypothetical protein